MTHGNGSSGCLWTSSKRHVRYIASLAASASGGGAACRDTHGRPLGIFVEEKICMNIYGVCCFIFLGVPVLYKYTYCLRSNTRTRPLKLLKNDGFDRLQPAVVCDLWGDLNISIVVVSCGLNVLFFSSPQSLQRWSIWWVYLFQAGWLAIN